MDDARRDSITRALARLMALAAVDRRGEAAWLTIAISGEIAALAVDAYCRGGQDGARLAADGDDGEPVSGSDQRLVGPSVETDSTSEPPVSGDPEDLLQAIDDPALPWPGPIH